LRYGRESEVLLSEFYQGLSFQEKNVFTISSRMDCGKFPVDYFQGIGIINRLTIEMDHSSEVRASVGRRWRRERVQGRLKTIERL